MAKQRIKYFESFDEDFFQDGKVHKLKEDYKWIRKDFPSRFLSALIYANAVIFGNLYCRLFLHTKIEGAKKLRILKGKGFFLYGNHTQPVGDVFLPALACFPKRIYTVVNPANLDLPVIGKILPFLGALPIPDTLSKMKEFNIAAEQRINEGHPVIIYPEAHVWEYYCGIRPFSDTSFKFPVKCGCPAFCMTTTYQKRRFFKRPKTTLYIDGPFYPAGDTKKEKAESLRNQIKETMEKRSENSNCEYIKYLKKSAKTIENKSGV